MLRNKLMPCGLIASLAMAGSPAFAEDDVDKAFKAQGARPAINASTSQGVYDQANQRQQAVVERAIERERRRADEVRGAAGRGDQSGSSRSATSRPGGAVAAAASERRYRCQYICSNKAVLTYSEKAHQSLTVHASSEKAAVSKAVEQAKTSCFRATGKIFDAGTASCRPD